VHGGYEDARGGRWRWKSLDGRRGLCEARLRDWVSSLGRGSRLVWKVMELLLGCGAVSGVQRLLVVALDVA
jgi:hypothetical protein